MIASKSGDGYRKDDVDLLREYQSSGDLEKLGQLFERYIHLIYGVCLKYLKSREDSKDAVMSIFEKLVTDLPKHEIKNLKSWLYVTSKNFCLMKLRSVKHKVELNSIEINEDPGMELSVPLHHNEKQLEDDLQLLEQCIDELKSDQRKAVKLFFLEQKGYRQIVEQTGFDLKKVKSYIQNGKRNLKICVERKREKA